MNNYLIIILIIIFFLLFNKKTNPKNEEFGISTVKSDFHYKELKKRNLKVIGKKIINTENNKIVYHSKINNPESARISNDKSITSRILQINNIPIPNYVSFNIKENSLKDLEKSIINKKLNYPLVLKPTSGQQGKGVILDIRNFNELKKNINKLSKTLLKKNNRSIIDTTKFIIEEQKQGNSFRIYIIYDKILDIYTTEKSSVIGTGKHNVLQLINIFNKKADNKTVFPIKYDKRLILSQISLKSIVPKNKKIIVSNIATRRNGGKISKVELKNVHPDNIKMFKKAQKVLGLTKSGIDYITNDISISWKKGNGFVNEVNDGPAFEGHLTVNKNNKKRFYDRLAKILKSKK